MPVTTDVAIIGGGAAGCAVAYYLAEAGIKSTIIEREGVGSQASGYAAGGLNPLTGHGIPGPLGKLAWESFRMHHGLYPELGELTAIDYQLRRVSEIKLTLDESGVSELEALARRFNAEPGFEASTVDHAQAAEIEPRINTGFAGCVIASGNYQLDSLAFTQALYTAALHAGTEFWPGTVHGIEVHGETATRVLLDDGELDCGQVVLAMGPWSRRAESWLNAYIPVDPLKGEIVRMRLQGEPLAYDISCEGASIYSKTDGQIWCGTTEEWRGFDRQPLDATRESIIAKIRRILPSITDATLEMHTACLRPVTPDWLPILGRVPGYRNAWLATGAGKKGILLAPGIGKSVADLIASGATALSIDNFAPERFAAPGTQ